ncbi:hypothetical protein ACFLTS_02630 [Chloroflexota bacterium]
MPDGADFIGEINIADILMDKDITDIYDAYPKGPDYPQDFEDALDWVNGEIDIDISGFESVVFFSNIAVLMSATTDEDIPEYVYYGAIVTGAFDEESLLGVLEKAMGEEFSLVEYKGYDIFADKTDLLCIAFFRDGIFALGNIEAVEDVIDVREGDMSAASGSVMEVYDELGNALIKVAEVTPPGYQALQGFEDIIGEDFPLQLPPDLAEIMDTESGGFAFLKDGSLLSMLGISLYSSSDAAENAGKAIEGLLMMMRMLLYSIPMGDLPEEFAELYTWIIGLFDEMEVSVSESWLSMRFDIPLIELKDIIVKFQYLIEQEGMLTY